MRVLLLHPEWSRSCKDCLTWLYDDQGRVSKRAGLPVLRPAGTSPPCLQCEKIPHGEVKVRANAVELSERNFLAYQHYLECRATGSFPDDAIVRRNARVLRSIMDDYEQRPLAKLIGLLQLMGPTHGR